MSRRRHLDGPFSIHAIDSLLGGVSWPDKSTLRPSRWCRAAGFWCGWLANRRQRTLARQHAKANARAKSSR
jgi:hypothetical protein